VAVTAPATTPGINFTMSAGGQITGRVINAVTGAGIGGIVGFLYNPAGVYLGVSSTTSCTGDYTISGLPTGTYKEGLGTSGYAHDRRYRAEVYDNVDCALTCSVAAGAPIPVTQGSTTTNINTQLIRYRTVADFNADRST